MSNNEECVIQLALNSRAKRGAVKDLFISLAKIVKREEITQLNEEQYKAVQPPVDTVSMRFDEIWSRPVDIVAYRLPLNHLVADFQASVLYTTNHAVVGYEVLDKEGAKYSRSIFDDYSDTSKPPVKPTYLFAKP